MSNKGNFSQAMREIFGVDSSKDKGKEDDSFSIDYDRASSGVQESKASANDRLNQDFSQTFKPANANEDSYAKAEKESKDEKAFYEKENFQEAYKSGGYDSSRLSRDYSSDIGPYGSIGNDGHYEEDEVGTTIITKNTVIEGNIKSFENIELNGKVKGKIETTKNVGVAGCVQGDIAATDILLEGAQIKGNILSKGALLMDKDTLLLGDVEAQNTRVDGKIKGEVRIGGNGEFLSNSVVVGDISVSNFYVQYGARMQGYINTNFSKNEEDSIFGKLAGN